jgi:hypothetical protein
VALVATVAPVIESTDRFPVLNVGVPQPLLVGVPTMVKPNALMSSSSATPVNGNDGEGFAIARVSVALPPAGIVTEAALLNRFVTPTLTGAFTLSVALKSCEVNVPAAPVAVALAPGTVLVKFASALSTPVCTGIVTEQSGPGLGAGALLGTVAAVNVAVWKCVPLIRLEKVHVPCVQPEPTGVPMASVESNHSCPAGVVVGSVSVTVALSVLVDALNKSNSNVDWAFGPTVVGLNFLFARKFCAHAACETTAAVKKSNTPNVVRTALERVTRIIVPPTFGLITGKENF